MVNKQSEVEKSVLLIENWLLNSGAQNLSRDPHKRGGFAAWYEIDKQLYPFLYSEISGYAITTLVYLNNSLLLHQPQLIHRAELAAEWLYRCARLSKGGIRTRYYLVKHYETPNYSFHQARVYTFDTAIVGYGLLQLYKITKKKKYLDWVWEITDFIIGKMRRKDGLFHAYYDSIPNRPGEDFEKWSDQAGSFHAKLALLFVDLWKQTRDPRLKRVTKELLDASLTLQKPEGRFVTNLKDGSTHLHPHCYTMEGLVYGYHHMNLKEYERPIKKSMAWALRAVGEDGSISTFYKSGQFDFHERSDIVAQVLRLGAVLYGLGVYKNRKFKETLQKVRSHLNLFIYREQGKQNGGILYGAATDGLMRMHLNTWCGMFVLQAVMMHDRFVRRGEEVRLDQFV